MFTLFVKALVFVEQGALQYIGNWYAIRPWDANADLVASLTTGLALGLVGAYVVNKDNLHEFLRSKGISTRSSQPSEWCGILTQVPLFCVLHFKDDRRLFGWPEVWPSDPDKGHFFMVYPVWVHETPHMPMTGVEGILISVADIKHIEFVQPPKGSTNGFVAPTSFTVSAVAPAGST